LGPTVRPEERRREEQDEQHGQADLERVLRDERARGEQQRVARQDREEQTRLDEDDDHDAHERGVAEALDERHRVHPVGAQGGDRPRGAEARGVRGPGQGGGELGEGVHGSPA
jgi:hypothetical protein